MSKEFFGKESIGLPDTSGGVRMAPVEVEYAVDVASSIGRGV